MRIRLLPTGGIESRQGVLKAAIVVEGTVKVETIHVALLREAVGVWAPVDAEHLHDDVYRIVDCRGEDEEAAFGRGTLVRCTTWRFSGDEEDVLVAVELVKAN